VTDIVLKLKMKAHLKAEQNKGFGRVGKAWAKESELEWQAADTIAALTAERDALLAALAESRRDVEALHYDLQYGIEDS